MPTRCCRFGVVRVRDRCLHHAVLIAIVLAAGAGARAEMSGDEYRSPASVTTPSERQRLAEQLERERAQAAEREARQAAERAASAEAERRRMLERPLGERLLEARCSSCHRPEVVAGVRHTALGWRVVVERMRWWHGADVPRTDVAPIVAHLAATLPATGARAVLEWGALAAATLSLLVAAIAYHVRLRRTCKGGPR